MSNPKNKKHFLIANIYQAKDIIPMDDDTGTSDPYVKVYFYGQEQKTNTIMKTLNPIWNC